MSVSEERDRLLGEAPIGKLLMQFSLPAIVGMLVMSLYNIVDRIFLGQVSSQAIAAVYVSFPIALIIMAISMGIAVGGSALASIRLGEKNRDEAERILGNVFLLLMLAGLVLMIGMEVFLLPLLRLFGSSETLLHDAAAYQSIILLALPLQMISFGLNNFIRAEGSPRTAMSTMLIGAVSNGILDFVFIILLGYGVRGAAIATAISQSISAVWVLSYFFSKRSMLKIRRVQMKPDVSLIKKFLILGIPSMGMQLAAALVMTIFNHQLKMNGGDLAVAAMGIIQSISMLALMPVFGINQGVQPIIGYNYGARHFQRVRQALKLGIIGATIWMTVSFAVLYIFPDQILYVFASDPKAYAQLYPVAYSGMRIYFITLPIIAYPIVGGIYFQATGQAKMAIFLSLSRQLIILIPTLLILSHFWGLNGIWASYPVSDIISTAMAAYFLHHALWSRNDFTCKRY